ncbi:lipase family protein [Peribacillus sp. SCS-37]|uniref:lipase family protein n=1 Tax=Paraperibacillus esterisolvens TaxID=3115296 RepID=UPI003905A6E2
MRSEVRDEVFQKLSQYSYNENPNNFTLYFKDGKQKWSVVKNEEFLLHDKTTGFDATVYKHKNDIVIAFRGTQGDDPFGEGFQDILTDIDYVATSAKVNEMGLNINWVNGKPRIDFHKENQFRYSDLLVKDVKKAYPDASIYTTGHSLGGGEASYSAAINGVGAVTFNSPSTVHLLLKEMKEDVKKGKFDKQIVNYVHPKDSISAGALKPYDRHIGSTYYIGSTYQLENQDTPSAVRFFETLAGPNYHGMKHYSFDGYGNINNPQLLNVLTGQIEWKSPRYINKEWVSIDLTPEHLVNLSKQIKPLVGDVQDTCSQFRITALSLHNIRVTSHVVDELLQAVHHFEGWFEEETTGLANDLESSAQAFVKADVLP